MSIIGKLIKDRSALNKQIVFISSTGRTGTKFFEGFFNGLNRGITCLHEPSPDLFNLAIAKIREDIDSKSVLDKLFHSRKHLILENENNNLYIESNPFIFPLLEDIKQKFTKTKFVFIIRDPKTYLT